MWRPHTVECPRTCAYALYCRKLRVIGLYISIICLAVVASQKCKVAQNSEKIWTYSSSRSSKIIDFGTNRKRICDFLLVCLSNLGPILHRFWDTATYLLKIAYFSYLPLIRRPHSLCSLWNFAVKLTTRKLKSWGKVRWSKLHPFWLVHLCDGRIDRRTDRRAIAYSTLSIYAVARNINYPIEYGYYCFQKLANSLIRISNR